MALNRWRPPPDQVVRVVREDLRNPDVLWLGTEMRAFWSWNGGRNWLPLDGNMPTVAVNDLVVHPRVMTLSWPLLDMESGSLIS